MRKKDWSPIYDRIAAFVEDAVRTHYRDDKEKGFKFWAVSQVLMDTDLSDDEIKEPLRLDARSDLGLDGYYKSSSSPNSTRLPRR